MPIYMPETPIQPIVWPDTDNFIYMKRDDLIPFSFGGNKVRIAAEFLADMEKKGCDCMITYGQSKSNLCRVISNLCAAAGMPCYVVSPLEEGQVYTETFNSRLCRSFGARILPCPKTGVAPFLDQLITRLKSEGKNPYYVYGNIYGKGNERTACTSYRKAFKEIDGYMQKNGAFDYLFHASATGTTQAGLLAGAADAGSDVTIVGISAAREKSAGLAAIRANLEALEVTIPEEKLIFDDSSRCGGYGAYDDALARTIDRCMLQNGIPLDPTYTGKAFHGMLKYLKENNIHGKKILFLHTGGAPLFFDYQNAKTHEPA